MATGKRKLAYTDSTGQGQDAFTMCSCYLVTEHDLVPLVLVKRATVMRLNRVVTAYLRSLHTQSASLASVIFA